MTMAPRQEAQASQLNDQVVDEIWAWMGRRRMNRTSLGRALGESHMWVRRRLSEGQVLNLTELERIASVLDVDVVDLFPARRSVGSNER